MTNFKMTRTCSQCGHKTAKEDVFRCPRCNKSLIEFKSCSGCTKCSSSTDCFKEIPR